MNDCSLPTMDLTSFLGESITPAQERALDAYENRERMPAAGRVARYAALGHAEFYALPEGPRDEILSDLTRIIADRDQVSYTIPRNRNSMGCTIRGLKDAPYVVQARDVRRVLVVTPEQREAADRAREARAVRVAEITAMDRRDAVALYERVTGQSVGKGMRRPWLANAVVDAEERAGVTADATD